MLLPSQFLPTLQQRKGIFSFPTSRTRDGKLLQKRIRMQRRYCHCHHVSFIHPHSFSKYYNTSSTLLILPGSGSPCQTTDLITPPETLYQSFHSAGLACVSCGYGEVAEESEAAKKAVEEVIFLIVLKDVLKVE